ncbi:MAG: SDR family oxidoreductase [Pseudomonadota bacterium]
MHQNPVALVTGANRGMGLATCAALAQQHYTVLLGSRSLSGGESAAAPLRESGLDVRAVELDVDNADQIAALANTIKTDFDRIDVLVNNAGILVDPLTDDASIFDASREAVLSSFVTNTLGPVLLTNALLPLMRERNYGRVVNVSSGMGQLGDMGAGHAGYRISKTALNSTTAIYATELAGTNVKVNAMCPGWVRTDMGTEHASRSIAEGIDTTLWLATLPDDGPSGGFFRDRNPIDW